MEVQWMEKAVQLDLFSEADEISIKLVSIHSVLVWQKSPEYKITLQMYRSYD